MCIKSISKAIQNRVNRKFNPSFPYGMMHLFFLMRWCSPAKETISNSVSSTSGNKRNGLSYLRTSTWQ